MEEEMFKEYYLQTMKKSIAESTNQELFVGLLNFTKDKIQNSGYIQGKKKLYYISAEFLIGKLL